MNPCQGTNAHEAVEPIIRSWSRRISRWLLNLLWTLWSLGAIILLWYTGFDAGYLGVPVDTVWPTNPTPPDPETGLRPAGNSNSWTQYYTRYRPWTVFIGATQTAMVLIRGWSSLLWAVLIRCHVVLHMGRYLEL